MTRKERRRRKMAGPLTFVITQEEILADLHYPSPPPGSWLGRDTSHIDRVLYDIEDAA